MLIAGKRVVVAGYGWCGKGVASRARGMGAKVIVTEVDPVRAFEAAMDGFEVMTMKEAARVGDLFITLTGDMHVIAEEHLKAHEGWRGGLQLRPLRYRDRYQSADQALSPVEKDVRNFVDAYVLAWRKRIYLHWRRPAGEFSRGRRPSGFGDGHEFCDSSIGIRVGGENPQTLTPKVYEVPVAVENWVAKLKLSSMGIRIDTLTKEQEKYLSSWDHGT